MDKKMKSKHFTNKKFAVLVAGYLNNDKCILTELPLEILMQIIQIIKDRKWKKLNIEMKQYLYNYCYTNPAVVLPAPQNTIFSL